MSWAAEGTIINIITTTSSFIVGSIITNTFITTSMVIMNMPHGGEEVGGLPVELGGAE